MSKYDLNLTIKVHVKEKNMYDVENKPQHDSHGLSERKEIIPWRTPKKGYLKGAKLLHISVKTFWYILLILPGNYDNILRYTLAQYTYFEIHNLFLTPFTTWAKYIRILDLASSNLRASVAAVLVLYHLKMDNYIRHKIGTSIIMISSMIQWQTLKQKRSTEGCSKFKSPETRQVQERLLLT